MSWTSDNNCCLTGLVLARTRSVLPLESGLLKYEDILLDLVAFLLVELLGELEMFLFRLVTDKSRWGGELFASMAKMAW